MKKTSPRSGSPNPTRTGRAKTGRATLRAKFAADEYVRIVPLHAAKPSVRELVRAELRDPFDGLQLLAAPVAKLTYRGGALLQNVEVFTIFWGKQWATAASAKALMTKINQFFTDIVTSALIDQLAEYNVVGKKIGHGKFVGSKVITANAPSGSISDSQIAKQLGQWISGKVVPMNNKNSLYFVYVDPGVVSIMGGSKSCQNYCGYHNNAGARYYAVMPYPGCTGCLGRSVRHRCPHRHQLARVVRGDHRPGTRAGMVRRQQWRDRRHLRLELQAGRRLERPARVVQYPGKVRIAPSGAGVGPAV